MVVVTITATNLRSLVNQVGGYFIDDIARGGKKSSLLRLSKKVAKILA
jgi:hypothetical protein